MKFAIKAVVLGLALTLVLAACNSTSSTRATPTPTPVPTIAPGELGVFLSAAVFPSATPGQAGGPPSSFKLAALRAATGAQLWSKTLTEAYSGPIADGGVLYGALSPLTFGGGQPQTTFTALRASDGAQVWQAPSAAGSAIPVLAADGTVYAVVFKPDGAVQSQLLALRESDGGQLWAADLAGLVGGAAGGPLVATANGALYLTLTVPPQQGSASPQFEVVALRASDGKQQWSTAVTSAINGGISALVLSGDSVYVAGQFLPPTSSNIPAVPTVVALAASDGSTRWTRQFTTPLPEGQMSLVAGTSDLYASIMLQPQDGSQLPAGELVALNPQSGAQAWSVALAAPALTLVAGTAAVYAAIGLPGASGPGGTPIPSTIGAYNESDGKQLWSQPIQVGSANLIAAANGSVFASVSTPPTQGSAGPGATMIESLSASDGSLIWKVEADGVSHATVAPL